MVVYAWLLGVFGLYGDAAAQFTRTISVYILKYGLSLFGAVLIVILPFRVRQALERNQQLEDEAKAKAELERKIQEDALKLAVAKKLEEAQKYE